jgi:hypothetical protein
MTAPECCEWRMTARRTAQLVMTLQGHNAPTALIIGGSFQQE